MFCHCEESALGGWQSHTENTRGEKMKFLITGGCGFIGSHLAEELLLQGNKVEVIDDLSTGSIDNVSSILKNPDFSLVIDNILNTYIVEELVRRNDFVFHLAAVVGVKKVLKNPVNSILINVEGTHNILKNCARFRKKVLLTSTSEIYGKNENIPFSENADIIIGTTKKRRWSYACTKAIDEFLALAYFEEEKLPVIIVRLFNTVGPKQSAEYGMVIPKFVKQAITHKPITVFGTGEQTRCFIHIKDVVKVLLKIITKEKAYGEIFNIGSQEEITISELAKMIKKLAKSSSKIIYMNPEEVYPEGFEDMKRRVPDISKIKNIVDFIPAFSTENIVTEIISYYKNLDLT